MIALLFLTMIFAPMRVSLRLFILTLGLFIFNSCEKTDSENPDDQVKLLSKVNTWDPATGTESNVILLNYNSEKALSSVFIAPYTYNLEYNAGGKLSRAIGLDASGNQMKIEADYNSAGQVIKSTVSAKAAGMAEAIVRFDSFEYNAAGKIIRISTFAPDGLTVTATSEYVWTGNNIQECTMAKGETAQIRKTNSFTTSALGYDDKVNPMTKLGQLGELVFSRAFSRNNPTQMKVKDAVMTDFITEAFPIYEYKDGAVMGVKYNLNEGNSLIHMSLAGNKGLKFGYE